MVCTFCTPHHTYPVHSLNNDLDGPLHIIQSKQWTPRQRQYPGSTTCYTFQANIVDNLEMLYSYSHSLTENLFLSRFVFQITFFQAYLIRLWDYLYFLLLSQYLPFLATSKMFFILLNYIQHFPPIIFFHFHILHIQLEDILTLIFSQIFCFLLPKWQRKCLEKIFQHWKGSQWRQNLCLQWMAASIFWRKSW